MSALNSGMHVVFVFLQAQVERIAINRFYFLISHPAPEDYERYCISPTGSIRLERGVSGHFIYIPIHLEGEQSGRSFSYDIEICYTVSASVRLGRARVEGFVHSSSEDVENIVSYLENCGSLRWDVPFDWFSVPGFELEMDVAEAVIIEDNLVVGMAFSDIPGSNRDYFVSDFVELPRRTRSIGIAISRQIAMPLLDYIFEDILLREARGEHMMEIGYEYELSSLDYIWGESSLEINGTGSITYHTPFGDNWNVGINCQAQLMVASSDTDPSSRRFQLSVSINVPYDFSLLDHSEYEERLYDEIEERVEHLRSLLDISPPAYAEFPDSNLGSLALSLTAGAQTIEDISFPMECWIESFDPVGGSLNVSPRTLEIEFTHNSVDPWRAPCGSAPRAWDSGVKSGEIFFHNGKDAPVGVEISLSNSDRLAVNWDSTILDPDERATLVVTCLTDHLPEFYSPDLPSERFDETVTIRHSACDFAPHAGAIDIGVGVLIHYEHHSFRNPMSDDTMSALCGWADILMIKRGFLRLADSFRDDIDDPRIENIYLFRVTDPRVSYVFQANDDEGNLLAYEAVNTTQQVIQLPLASKQSIFFDLAYRSSDVPDRLKKNYLGNEPKGPFNIGLRGISIARREKIELSGFTAFIAIKTGFCVAVKNGITLYNTIYQKQPLQVSRNTQFGAVTDMDVRRNLIFTVGKKGLCIGKIKDLEEIELISCIKDVKNGILVGHYKKDLWVVTKTELLLYSLSVPEKPKMQDSINLTTPVQDMAVGRMGLTLLDGSGLMFYTPNKKKIKQTGNMQLDKLKQPHLIQRAGQIGVTHSKGSLFYDISNTRKPQLVAKYREPYWQSNIIVNMINGVAYRVDREKGYIEICDIRRKKISRG